LNRIPGCHQYDFKEHSSQLVGHFSMSLKPLLLSRVRLIGAVKVDMRISWSSRWHGSSSQSDKEMGMRACLLEVEVTLTRETPGIKQPRHRSELY